MLDIQRLNGKWIYKNKKAKTYVDFNIQNSYINICVDKPHLESYKCATIGQIINVYSQTINKTVI